MEIGKTRNYLKTPPFGRRVSTQFLVFQFPLVLIYRKHPTISPGLIYFRKRFVMGLYKGGGLYTGGGLIHGRSFVLVINKSDINKSVINRKINMY